jgi:hypothetical protein
VIALLTMRSLPLVLASMMIAVGLAGCTDGGADATEGAGTNDPGSFQLQSGMGAIAGLLVDDRFRPIHLVENPTGEFQTTGFVLLQETGEQARTNENGEFTFVNLEPGTYTLRVTAAGHEAIPQRVTIADGVFNELSVIARRTASQGSTVITEEYTAFVPCQVSAVAATAQCIVIPPDQSGDTNRQGFWTDYRELDVSFVVIEMLSNREAGSNGALKVVARNGTNDAYVTNDAIVEGNYMKVWLQNGERSPHDIENRNAIWTNEDRQQVQIWAQGQFKQETQAVFSDGTCTVGLYCSAESRGIGAQSGLVVRFVISIFLGPPEADIEAYCLLC